jgi:hypothetical protein
MNANPFIKPEVGQQSANYVSQYVPLPFEMMQKKADIMQKELDLNNAKGAAVMGMLKVQGLGPKAQAYANEELSKIEDQIRQVSSIGDPGAQSEALNQLGEEVHTRLTRGDLAHIQAQHDAVYGKDQYADQVEKDRTRDHITGELARDYMGHTLAEYDKNFDPKNPTKTRVNPYTINKAVNIEKELQPLLAQIQRKVTENFGDTKNVTYDATNHQFLEYVNSKYEVIPKERIDNITKGLIKNNELIQNHLRGNVAGLYGEDAAKNAVDLAVANLAGINIVNDEKHTLNRAGYAFDKDPNGRSIKPNEDLGLSFNNSYVGSTDKEGFLGDPNANQFDKFGEVKGLASQNLVSAFTDSFRSTMNLNSRPDADVVNASIIKTMQANGLSTDKQMSATMQDQFMEGLATGKIKTIVNANGTDIYKNNKPAFIELKRKAEFHHNQVEMANLQMERAFTNAGIPESAKSSLKTASRADYDNDRVVSLIKSEHSKKTFDGFKPKELGYTGLRIKGILKATVAGNINELRLEDVNMLLSYPALKAKSPALYESLNRLKVSKTAQEKTKPIVDKLNRELQTMAKTQETAKESQLSRVALVHPVTGKTESVDFSSILSNELEKHEGSLSGKVGTLSSPDEDGNFSLGFNDFVMRAAEKMPAYAKADDAGKTALINSLTKKITAGVKLSGTKDKDGNHQVIFDYGGQQLHIPVAFGTGAVPENGFKISRTLDPSYSAMINTETTVGDALRNRMIYTPLGDINNGVQLYTNSGNSTLQSDGTLSDGVDVRLDLGKYGGAKGRLHVIPRGEALTKFINNYNLVLEHEGSQEAKAYVQRWLAQNKVLGN